MDIIISINDTDAKAFLDQVQAAYGWTGLAPDEVAAKLSEEIKADLVDKAVRGQETIEREAKKAATKESATGAFTVTTKV